MKKLLLCCMLVCSVFTHAAFADSFLHVKAGADQTLLDESLGLTWFTNTVEGLSWKDALEYCEELKVSGYDDWRLPTIEELETISGRHIRLDKRKSLPEAVRKRKVMTGVWSSSLYQGSKSEIWCLYEGKTFPAKSNKKHFFYAVRGDADSLLFEAMLKNGRINNYRKPLVEKVPRFEDNGDGTVTDLLTGWVWALDAGKSGELINSKAAKYCEELEIAGYDDWTLPSIEQLMSLLDRDEEEPALPKDHPFKKFKDKPYWSSNRIDNSYWCVNFENGQVFTQGLYDYVFACVVPVRKSAVK